MDAIMCGTPVFILKTNTTEQDSTKKRLKTSKPCYDQEKKEIKTKDELKFASMFIDLMSVTIKQLGKQVKSLKEENAELREKLEDQKPQNLDLVA
ncbi:MAG: hypothetical protein PHC34_06950 [Candidatus Gastranaerophilales bacterium]|nr:hypothetical protein [Candidatus Gastranaerophilales bacterium]